MGFSWIQRWNGPNRRGPGRSKGTSSSLWTGSYFGEPFVSLGWFTGRGQLTLSAESCRNNDARCRSDTRSSPWPCRACGCSPKCWPWWSIPRRSWWISARFLWNIHRFCKTSATNMENYWNRCLDHSEAYHSKSSIILRIKIVQALFDPVFLDRRNSSVNTIQNWLAENHRLLLIESQNCLGIPAHQCHEGDGHQNPNKSHFPCVQIQCKWQTNPLDVFYRPSRRAI